MDQNHLPVVTRSPSNVPSRRTLVRALVWLGLGHVPRLANTAQARKRKRKRKPNPKPQPVCQPGQLLEIVSVPATGVEVLTPVLREGQRYRLRASTWWYSNATHGQDAFADFSLADPSSHTTVFQGVRLGITVDGGSPDLWGSYSPDHTYERTVTGRGAALRLRCIDVNYGDNSGVGVVEVFCA